MIDKSELMKVFDMSLSVDEIKLQLHHHETFVDHVSMIGSGLIREVNVEAFSCDGSEKVHIAVTW